MENNKNRKQVLIIDDNTQAGERFVHWLQLNEYVVQKAAGIYEAIKLFSQYTFNFIFSSNILCTYDGCRQLYTLKKTQPATAVIIVADFEKTNLLTSTMNMFCNDFSVITEMLNYKISEPLYGNNILFYELSGIWTTQSLAMASMYLEMNLVAPTNYNVVIEGETGAGKEYIAKRIHERSTRRNFPYIVNNYLTRDKDSYRIDTTKASFREEKLWSTKSNKELNRDRNWEKYKNTTDSL